MKIKKEKTLKRTNQQVFQCSLVLLDFFLLIEKLSSITWWLTMMSFSMTLADFQLCQQQKINNCINKYSFNFAGHFETGILPSIFWGTINSFINSFINY